MLALYNPGEGLEKFLEKGIAFSLLIMISLVLPFSLTQANDI